MYDKLIQVLVGWVEALGAYFAGKAKQRADDNVKALQEERDAALRKADVRSLSIDELDDKLLDQLKRMPRRTRIPHD